MGIKDFNAWLLSTALAYLTDRGRYATVVDSGAGQLQVVPANCPDRAQLSGVSRMCKPFTVLFVVLLTFLSTHSLPLVAQEQEVLSQAELDQMMAPVALYPDSLLSQMLMASTYPAQVEEAAKWSKDHPDMKGDAAVEAVQDQAWDPSVASLVAFPQVLDMMGSKPDWVKQMGDAFLADSEEVMNTVQELRAKAKEEGNLETTEQQTVVVDKSTTQTIIKIEPADPQIIYVPSYNPLVVYGPWWWPAYRPYYYMPPPYYGYGSALAAGIAFGIGVGIVNSIWGGFNWRRHDVNINVNRYNKININNRLTVNKTNVAWKHNPINRKGVPYADRASRDKFGGKLSGADKRKDFRGRDADREKARATLRDKGIDPATERKRLSGAGGEQVRDQVNKIDRQNRSDLGGRVSDRSASGNRDLGGKLSDRSAPSKSGVSGKRDSAKSSGLSSGKQRDISHPTTSQRRDNAFNGVGNGDKTRRSSDRGARSTSRSIGSSRSGGSITRGGGGGRSLGGGGLRR